MSSDLVKRLRDRREYQSRGHGEVVDVADGDCSEAADRIEALEGEVERLTSDVDALGENLEKVVAERDRLKAALEELQEDNMWLQVVQGNLRAIMRAHQKDCPNCRGRGSIEVPYDSADLNDTSTVTEDCKQCARLRSALGPTP